MNHPKVLSAVLILLLIGCNSPKKPVTTATSREEAGNQLKGSISISGAYALYPLISALSERFMEVNPGVKIEVNRIGTGEGIADLLTGKCQIAMISRPLTDEEISSGIWVVPVAKDGVAPIVNQKNPYLGKLLEQGISPDEFVKVFLSGNKVTWGQILGIPAPETIDVYIRSDQSGAADIWSQFLYKEPEDLKGSGVQGDNAMIESIRENPFSIGFCNFSYAFDAETGQRAKDIQIVPADLDFDNKIDKVEMPFANLEQAHRSLWLGFYPDQLCRELTLGCMGKPTDPVAIKFINFVLGEGQTMVKKTGFCPLNDVYIRYAKELLE
ncbi:MAG: substrate-binding domain-containing protein [Bacteroidales bacterium]